MSVFGDGAGGTADSDCDGSLLSFTAYKYSPEWTRLRVFYLKLANLFSCIHEVQRTYTCTILFYVKQFGLKLIYSSVLSVKTSQLFHLSPARHGISVITFFQLRKTVTTPFKTFRKSFQACNSILNRNMY